MSGQKTTHSHPVAFSKAQMKIQQMAFLLVALTIFFAIVGLIYFSITLSNVRNSAKELEDEEAILLANKLVGSPELAFTSSSGCASCLDMDKAFQLKEKNIDELLNVEHLFITRLSPEYPETECTQINYPGDCDKIILLEGGDSYATKSAFVTLVRWDNSLGSSGGYRYELGRIEVSPKKI